MLTVTELSNYYKEHPITIARRMPLDEDEEKRSRNMVNKPFRGFHMIQRQMMFFSRDGNGPHHAILPVFSFSDRFIPIYYHSREHNSPDTHELLILNYCVTAINTVITSEKKCSNVSIVSTKCFFGVRYFLRALRHLIRVCIMTRTNKRGYLLRMVNQTTMGYFYFIDRCIGYNDPTGTCICMQ